MAAAHEWKGTKREIGEDFFTTPREAILPIKKYIPDNVKTILEPTYGTGAIGKVLEEWGYTVIKRDKYPKTADCEYADFLVDEIPECDMIIFNPPFCLKTDFLRRVCETGKPFLFICPLTILETAARYNLFKLHELSIVNLKHRTNFIEGKTVWFHSVWVLRNPMYPNKILFAE
jgi:hypothetical protein